MIARAFPGAIALVLAASACSGSSHTVPPSHRASAAARVAVSFTMHWPARAKSASDANNGGSARRAPRAQRRPAFVSPSTASVIVEVNPDASAAGPVTFANAPAGGGTSTIAIDAPPGADVFLISLYDQPQTSGETTAAGNELGRVRIAQTIVVNTTNTLNATVVGTVASIRVGPLPNQSNVLPVAAASPAAYELVGRAPATFAVAPLDAAGNVIVQPDAPPAISLAPNVRAAGLLSVTPVSGTTDRFTVQALAPNTTTYPTALVATATDANGGLATSSTVVDVTSAVYVAYANGGAPAVARFDPHGTPVPLPAGAFAGLGNPVALAYDADDREILVADAALGKVLAFDENGAAVQSFAAPGVAGANGVAYDAHSGNAYASGSAGVTVFAPDGGPPRGGVPPAFAATSAQGIAFVAGSVNGALNRIAAGNAAAPGLTMFSESGGAAGDAALPAAPVALAYGAPAGIGQSPPTNAQIYVTTASGVLARDAFGAAVASAANAGGPYGIAVDPNLGEPTVTERSSNAVTTYLDDLSAIDAARSFATPGSLGLIQPQGVCHVF
ncbi:MAG: hypothetical protein QOD51_3188 [Candidatus Eremiobacteraeota bacterium]|nr:hypothetical protein [Candidatus Eremiobacteraeota bacterium]